MFLKANATGRSLRGFFWFTVGGVGGASKDYSKDSPKIKLKDSPKVIFLNLNI